MKLLQFDRNPFFRYINETTILFVEQFDDEQNILSALRWVARGLPVSLAILKVCADYSLYGFKRKQ